MDPKDYPDYIQKNIALGKVLKEEWGKVFIIPEPFPKNGIVNRYYLYRIQDNIKKIREARQAFWGEDIDWRIIN